MSLRHACRASTRFWLWWLLSWRRHTSASSWRTPSPSSCTSGSWLSCPALLTFPFLPATFQPPAKRHFNSGGLTGCQINETIMVCISCSWWCPGTIAPSPPHLTVSLYLFNSGSNAWGEVDGPCWEDSPEIWIQLVEILTGMCVEFSWLCVTRARPSKLPRGFRNQYLDTARQFHMRYFLYRDVVRAGLVSLNMFMNF